ncbi:DeoR family transcriptional regulator, partial [Mycobacterium tuberculosis]|nr:DeoR family transcriptional regulator [Mycobacterium tuberculosis]
MADPLVHDIARIYLCSGQVRQICAVSCRVKPIGATPMLTRERKDHILGVLGRDGRVVAKAVAEALHLSEDTIRRDLRELAAEGR